MFNFLNCSTFFIGSSRELPLYSGMADDTVSTTSESITAEPVADSLRYKGYHHLESAFIVVVDLELSISFILVFQKSISRLTINPKSIVLYDIEISRYNFTNREY